MKNVSVADLNLYFFNIDIRFERAELFFNRNGIGYEQFGRKSLINTYEYIILFVNLSFMLDFYILMFVVFALFFIFF